MYGWLCESNFKIICVDDTSSDNCGRILDEYAEKDSCVKVIYQKMLGFRELEMLG